MQHHSFAILITLALALVAYADERDQLKVGVQPDGRIVVPTNQILQPAGKQVTFPGRPVDLLLIDDGKTLVAKNMRDLVFINTETGAIKQTLALPAAAKGLSGAFSAVGLLADDDRIYATDSQNSIRIAKRNDKGEYAWDGHITLEAPAVGGAVYPTGMAWSAKHLLVCSSRGNELQAVNIRTRRVEKRIPVGVAPYMVVMAGLTIYVSNWGGDPPDKEATHKTSGTPVRTDPRTSIANHGSVSVVQGVAGDAFKQIKTIPVGGHPSGMAVGWGESFVYVANANSDTVSVIDRKKNVTVQPMESSVGVGRPMR